MTTKAIPLHPVSMTPFEKMQTAKAQATHTPGPWLVYDNYGPTQIAVFCPGAPRWTATVAVVNWAINPESFGPNHPGGSVRRQQAEANARLIAAAPELLEACKLAHRWFAQHAHELRADSDAGVPNLACFEAIAKATGKG